MAAKSDPDAPPVKARILIVDDDRAVANHLSRMVADSGHDFMVASAWTDALRLYRENHPDLVLLDVMMPTMDGYKMASIFRREEGRFVPIILLTALEDVESKRRGMAAGADDFITKPVTQLELQIRLSSLLRIKVLTDQLANANRQLEQLAVTDALTSLHNRRYLVTELEREFKRSKRYGHVCGVLLLDIDHFKRVNDTFGHPVGDRVLTLMGEVLRAAVRNTDVVGRFGGEEFMILAPETGFEQLMMIAERIRSQVAAKSAASQPDLPAITVSIGAATTEDPQVASSDVLVRLADEALYQAKREGRDRVIAAARIAPAAPTT